MTKFYSKSNRPPRMAKEFSKKTQPVYKVTFNKKTGKRTLEVEKEINIYDKIQEYREEVKISNILKRYDMDMLKQLKKDEQQLIDLTNLPENLMETMAVIDEAKYAFDRQSKAIKEKFNNNFNEFIAASENGQLANLLNKELKTKVENFNYQNQANYMPQNNYQPNYSQNEPLNAQNGGQSNILSNPTQNSVPNAQNGGINV